MKAAHVIVALLMLLGNLQHVSTSAKSLTSTGIAPNEGALGSPVGDGSAKLSLPWATGETWTLSGGPHGSPARNALDFDFGGGIGRVRAAREGIAVIECPNTVRIDHVDGWSTVYAHVANVTIDNGQFVARGQHIGDTSDLPSCSVGSAEGNHLHFGVLRDSRPYDIQGMDIGGWTVQAGSRAYGGCLWRTNLPDPGCRPPLEIENDGTAGSWGSAACTQPELIAPDFDAVSRTRTIGFSWTPPEGCSIADYDFRIKTVPSMESGGVILADHPRLNQTHLTETVDYQFYERDLYWGVRATGAPGASWSVRRFRIQPSVDTSAPVVTWKAPRQEDQAILSVEAGAVILRAKATDNVRVKVVEFVRWDNSGRKFVLGADTQPSASDEYSAAAPIASLELNWNLVSAIAFDAAGNQTSQHIWLFRTTPGVPPISVRIKQPTPGQLVSTSRAPISIAASDNVGSIGALSVAYQIDDGPFVPAPFDVGSGRYRTSWDTTTFSDGHHQIRARATDLAGRSVYSDPVAVLVDNVNILPVADAGPDQRVIDVETNDGELAELDGSGSTYDPELSAVFQWYDRTSGFNVPIGVGQRITAPLGYGVHAIRLVVTDSKGRGGADDISIAVDLPNGTPNDDFDLPEVVPALPFTYWMHVQTATAAADDPIMCVPVRRTVWFAFTAPADEFLTIDTEDSSYDSALALFTGTRGQLERLACDANGWDSRVSFHATKGTTYYVMAGAVGPRDGGFFELHIQMGRGSEDTTKPNTWWIAPVERWNSAADTKTIRSRNVLLSAWAWDTESGIKRVRFSAHWSGIWHSVGDLYEPSATDVYTYAWDMCDDEAPDGEVQLGLQVYDNADNETVYSHQWTNTRIIKRFPCPRDTIPPAIAFQTPVANDNEFLVGEGVVSLKVHATDNVGVRKVVFERRDEQNQVVPIATVDGAPFVTSITVDELHMGPNQISAIAFDEAGNVSERSIRVIREKPVVRISLSTSTGRVGESIAVSLAGFPPSSSLPILWDGNRQSTATTSEAGEATTSFVAPPSPRGSHTIRAVLGAASASANFDVTPSHVLSPASGASGQTIEVALTGFVGAETIAIRWPQGKDEKSKKDKKHKKGKKTKKGKNGKKGKKDKNTKQRFVPVASMTADANGSAFGSFTVPSGATPGNKTVAATGSRGSKAEGAFLHLASPALAETPVLPASALADADAEHGNGEAESDTIAAIDASAASSDGEASPEKTRHKAKKGKHKGGKKGQKAGKGKGKQKRHRAASRGHR